ncbi:MAG: glutathione peroxidase [bacterium]|nr:glutathione peroxidase [bacterium]
MNIYDFTLEDANGQMVSLADYKGKVVLIVNTATGCGFTPQYKGLQELYAKYAKDGLEILDFPCNQFANQAPGTNQEIVTFCTINYGVKFKQFAKIDVNGKNESPLYTYLKSQKKGVFGKNIKWNFTKFLINREGEVVARFAPTDTPEKIEPKIKELL